MGEPHLAIFYVSIGTVCSDKQSGYTNYSIFKSFVTRSEAEDSAVARRGERDKVTDGLELELLRRLQNLRWH